MRLGGLQKELEHIYGIAVDYSVDDFLITDADLVRQLDTSCNSREVKEKLLICQSDDCLELSLYLDREVVDHLTREDPWDGLDAGNLNEFCIAVEGVSHFLYLMWNARLQKPVTLLELEMQAEVDKYVTCFCLLQRQNRKSISSKIRRILFYRAEFDDALDPKALKRYKDANFFAGKYCMQLEHEYLKYQRKPDWYPEIRNFYRLPQADKIRRIQSGRVTVDNH